MAFSTGLSVLLVAGFARSRPSGHVNDAPVYALIGLFQIASIIATVGLILCLWPPARWFGLALFASAVWSVGSFVIGLTMHNILYPP